jgi:8-oxo-dGTP pyrophosphatase MutT (NUDIX family)
MTAHDGNGWTRCSLGHRHWGRHGAAGLLVAAPGADGQTAVLLQQRSYLVSHGGAWSPPGGARDSHESAVHAAFREAAEECGIIPATVSVHGLLVFDHGRWTYQTVLAKAAEPFAAAPASDETRQVAWVPVAEVDQRRLHPGFAELWPALRTGLEPLTIVADVANIMGSRPDGWWRDRAGAAARLCGELALLATHGVTGPPESAALPVLDRWFPRIVAVLEGAAKAAATEAAVADTDGRLRVVRAAGSGDDQIAALAGSACGHRLVVTADRELRARCVNAGAAVAGPGWLLAQL